MKILSYSPSIHVVVACQGRSSASYYDVSADITSASITRKVDAASTFSIKLQNKSGKYNDVFKPWDMVAITLTKISANRVLTGYITDADVFSLYPQEMTIKGCCSLYRLQQFFWDAQLLESQRLMQTSSHFNVAGDAGYGDVAFKLLTTVGGWDAGSVRISKEIPQEVMDWARGLYEVKQTDIDQLTSMVNEFYEVLQTSGPQLTSGGGVAGEADFSGSDSEDKIWNFCMSQGFSKQAAAATIGNAMVESGCDPARMQGGGGPGRGLFQWETGSSRYNRLVQIASGMGKQWSDIEPQLTLFQEEAEGCFKSYTGKTYTYPNGTVTWWPQKVTYSEWKSWTNIEQATDCLERVYMRPSIPHRDRRQQYAREAYARHA